jgi:hypothetical protein
MAEDGDRTILSVYRGDHVLRFFLKTVVRAGLTVAVAATIHCADSKPRSKERE